MMFLTGKGLCLALLVTSIYILFGAGVFYALEHDNALQERRNFNDRKAELFAQGNFSTSQQKDVEDLMHLAATNPYSPYSSVWEDEHGNEIWSYGESIYFTLVTLSTVGFGDMSPQTSSGKTFLIFFTILGIPLMILVNLSLGSYVVAGVFYTMKRTSKSRYMTGAVSPMCLELMLLSVLLVMAFTTALIFAALLSIEQNWRYGDALYFTWTTLTTIGYGDFTIENNNFIVASIALIVLLSISFAAGSALVEMLKRVLHFKKIKESRDSRIGLVDGELPGGLPDGLPEGIEMKDMIKSPHEQPQRSENNNSGEGTIGS